MNGPTVDEEMTGGAVGMGVHWPVTMAPASVGGSSGVATAKVANINCDTPRVAGEGSLVNASYSASTKSCIPHPISIAGCTNMSGETGASSVVSSLTDGSASTRMSSFSLTAALQGQGGTPQKTLLISQRFLPDKRVGITEDFARNNFGFANHFDKKIPKTDNPTKEQVKDWETTLLGIHDNICNLLKDAILKHLQALARDHDVVDKNGKPLKNVVDIQSAALKMIDNECTEKYLLRALIFLKIPQKHDLRWVNQVKMQVKDQYCVRFPHSSETNFVESIAGAMFNDEWNQRLRRNMWNEGKIVWYNRMPAKINKLKIFQQTKVTVSRREFSIGPNFIKGYLVEKVSGDAAVAMELRNVASAALSKEEFMREAERLWNEKGVCDCE